MTYYVYTDASVRLSENFCSTAFIIYTYDKYICSGYKVIKGVSSTHIAEAHAVNEALEYIINNIELKENDKIKMNVDSMHIYKFGCKCSIDISKVVPPTGCSYLCPIYEKIKNLVCKIIFFKIVSHTGINPNGYVDRLCKVALND